MIIEDKYAYRYHCAGSGTDHYNIIDNDAGAVHLRVGVMEHFPIHFMKHADMLVRRLNDDRLIYMNMIEDYANGKINLQSTSK